LQNTSYVAQWWLFAAFTLVLWARVVRDTLRKTPPPDRSTAGTLALRTGAQPPARGGRAMLSTQDKNGVATVYRGYHLPDSSQVLVPSHGDPMHDAYNDYLWQLALSDGEDLPSATPAPAPESTSYADYDVPEIEARRRELGPDAG
ncbi:MAG: hypothetical protein J0H43_15900, partial [Actinobacteria bacterium]|nr:hypothetical protein [Actinomycetota bacterium]